MKNKLLKKWQIFNKGKIINTKNEKYIKQRYQYAEQLLPWNVESKSKNLSVVSNWISENLFWYKHDTKSGYEFMLVDTEKLSQAPLFDHQRFSDVITELVNKPFESNQLPIESIELCDNHCVRLLLHMDENCREYIELDLDDYHCVREAVEGNSLAIVSPGGCREVFCRDNNLAIYNRLTGHKKLITQNGEPNHGYGVYSDFVSIGLCENLPLRPAVVWSPDGRYLAVQRIDQRHVKALPVMQSVPEDRTVRPINQSYKIALPGDTQIAMATLCVIDTETEVIVECDRPPIPAADGGFMEFGHLSWGANSHCVYFTEWTRDREIVRLVAFDPVNGTSRLLVEDNGKGYIHPGPLPFELGIVQILSDSNEFIWYSYRSGWGHLYRYDLITGDLKNPVTSGEYIVTALHRVDSMQGCLYFTACGREPDRNPYFEHLYRVNLDGSELVLLTPEPSQHDVIPPGFVSNNFKPEPAVHGISPDGKVFVDTFSRIDQPPKSILRSTLDGRELMCLSQSDISLLANTPYKPPFSFTVKAADNTTNLWGVMHKPSDFDEKQRYPVILALYGAPQLCVVPKRFAQFDQYVGKIARTLAELGFIVVTLDPKGTPLRSKVFHQEAYGNMQNGGGIEDQISALKQLGERYSWMDLNRVGVTGHSAGGFASARAMLSHPDFFKVAVSSAGNHDLRLNVAAWGEAFQGLLDGENYQDQASINLAKNLKGKLLLVHGDMDANVHIAHTLQLVDKLIEHNRDFDLLILPNRRHNYMQDTYFIRRVWDYFVEHLLGEKPPNNYHITPPQH